MPFRGPGRSRITTVQNCEGEEAAAPPPGQCVKLMQTPNSQVVLSNECGSCRGVAIQRMDSSGRVLNRQAYKLKAKDVVPVAANGAARVSLIADIDCP